MTERRNKRDWRTPILLTLTVHLMAFTLFINHRTVVGALAEENLEYVIRIERNIAARRN